MRECFSNTCSFIKKFVISIVGFLVLFVGILLIFLPGPAFVVIPLGLSILALEFQWPRKLLRKINTEGKKFFEFLKKTRK